VKEYRERQFKKGDLSFNSKGSADFRELCRKQGLPEGFDLPPFTVAAKCKAVGNGVALPTGRAIAKAVKEAIYRGEESA
jgi:DNA (cytosine-5)-methyltransferase 1